MARRLRVFILTHGITLFITIATAMVLIFLTIVGFFIPEVYRFVVENHFFDIIALACLLEIVFILLKQQRTLGAWLYQEDLAMQNKVLEILKTERIAGVDIISAGMSSRTGLIQAVLSRGHKVRLLAQHPDSAIDKDDGKRVRDSINVFCHLRTEADLKSLTVKYNKNPVSVRAILLRGEPFAHSYAMIGWYTYHSAGSKINGRRNPTVFVSTASLEGRDLIIFVQQLFEKTWNNAGESETVPLPVNRVAQDVENTVA
ncbi:MAG: hypothetical protein HYX87_04745 [Chloroflexi bacterium]|nr:hypothetical protein [Chloroflexota bacterium]